MGDKKSSYTAADSLPIKLLKNVEIIESINNGKIIPSHIQFIPTNKCNLKCAFCSCSNDDRNTEMSLDDAVKIIDIFKKLGTKAVTITGGGSPCLHPNINEIISYFLEKDIKVGLVDNGLLLHKISPNVMNQITWCRISHADDRKFSPKYEEIIKRVVVESPNVDWAFSYVVSNEPNFDGISRVVDFANNNKFTHVRLVADLFQPKNVDLGEARKCLNLFNIDDSLVIYQDRDEPEHGEDCYICYLKPVIGADCNVYNCCGVQYALETPTKNLPQELSMGSAFNFESMIQKSSSPQNGSKCVRCYYGDYNRILKSLISDIDHLEFA